MTDSAPAHARLSPSAADRWMVCPGSVRLTEGMQETSSVYADEGTAAHNIRALCLELDLDAHHFIGYRQEINGHEFVWAEEDADYLQRGIDWVRQQPGHLVVEHRCDLSTWMPGQFGTMDTAIITDERLIVNDLKWGRGELVDAEDNKQLRIYALGMYDYARKSGLLGDHDRDYEIVIVIDQPRAGGQKEWLLSLGELLAFGEEVEEAAKRTYDPDAPFVASKKGCRWCKAKDRPGGCDTHTEWVMSMFDQSFDDIDEAAASGEPIKLPPASNLTPERRSVIVKNADVVRRWLADIHDRTLAAALAGEPTPGLKAVEGDKGNRKWIDETAVETILTNALGDEAFTKKVKSPAQVEKLIAPTKRKLGMPEVWESLRAHVGQESGKPVLVDESHEKPRLQTVDELFDDAE